MLVYLVRRAALGAEVLPAVGVVLVGGDLDRPIVLDRHCNAARCQAVSAKRVDGLRLNRCHYDETTSLGLRHRPISATLSHQLGVTTPLDDPPVIHHQDHVGIADRRKPVGDNETRTVTTQLAHRMLD